MLAPIPTQGVTAQGWGCWEMTGSWEQSLLGQDLWPYDKGPARLVLLFLFWVFVFVLRQHLYAVQAVPEITR